MKLSLNPGADAEDVIGDDGNAFVEVDAEYDISRSL